MQSKLYKCNYNYMSVLIYTSMFICTACKHVWIYVLHTFCLTCTLHTHRRCVQMYYLSEAPGRSHALSAAPASDVIAPYVNSKKKTKWISLHQAYSPCFTYCNTNFLYIYPLGLRRTNQTHTLLPSRNMAIECDLARGKNTDASR